MFSCWGLHSLTMVVPLYHHNVLFFLQAGGSFAYLTNVVHFNQRQNCFYSNLKKKKDRKKENMKCCLGKINTDPRLLLHSRTKAWWRHKPCLVSCKGGNTVQRLACVHSISRICRDSRAQVHNKHSAL